MPPDPPRGSRLRRSQNVSLPLILSRFQLLSLCWRLCPCVFRIWVAYHSNINYLVPILQVRTPPPPPPLPQEILATGLMIHASHSQRAFYDQLWSRIIALFSVTEPSTSADSLQKTSTEPKSKWPITKTMWCASDHAPNFARQNGWPELRFSKHSWIFKS